MSGIVKIDPERRIVYSVFYGDLTGQDLLQHGASIRSDPAFDRRFAEVVDLSGANVSGVTLGALAELASRESIYDAAVPHIIVAPPAVPEEIVLMYQKLTKQTRPNLFVVRTHDAARQMLTELGFPT
jgi:hypothetical protein